MTDNDPIQSSEKVYLDAPYLSIRWSDHDKWVIVEWKAWTDSATFRAAGATILAAISENRATALLIDLRKARVLADADQKWIVDEWGPRTMEAGIRRRAIVAPERSLPRTIAENVRQRIPSGAREVRAFGTLEEATGWLAS